MTTCVCDCFKDFPTIKTTYKALFEIEKISMLHELIRDVRLLPKYIYSLGLLFLQIPSFSFLVSRL